MRSRGQSLGLIVCAILPLFCSALPAHPFRSTRRFSARNQIFDFHHERASNLTHWIEQRLDHSASGHPVLWKQRYFSNETFFRKGGPVFFCVGGEGPALSPEVVVTGEEHCALMMHLAAEHGALALALEHRYYGESIPTTDLSTANLKYLSSHQALADIAYFHSQMAEIYGLDPGTKWVSFGGSYPGMLASWTRLKLPQLFHAAVSSSAPVEAIANMQGYNDVTGDDFADSTVGGSAECLQTIGEAFDTLGKELTSSQGRRKLETMFNVCGKYALEDVQNQALFTQATSDPLIPQSNDPSCSGKACNIEKQCAILLDPDQGRTPLDRLAALNQIAYNSRCIDCHYADMAQGLTNTTKEGGTDRVWFYQTCTEFAFYQTCDPDSRCPFTTQPHLNTLQSYYDMCKLAFDIDGEEVEASVVKTNDFYGGVTPAATRIFYINGQVDPWHVQSVLRSQPALPAMMVPGASHHFWTHPPQPTDAPEIVAARMKIAAWVGMVLLEDDGELVSA